MFIMMENQDLSLTRAEGVEEETIYSIPKSKTQRGRGTESEDRLPIEVVTSTTGSPIPNSMTRQISFWRTRGGHP